MSLICTSTLSESPIKSWEMLQSFSMCSSPLSYHFGQFLELLPHNNEKGTIITNNTHKYIIFLVNPIIFIFFFSLLYGYYNRSNCVCEFGAVVKGPVDHFGGSGKGIQWVICFLLIPLTAHP